MIAVEGFSVLVECSVGLLIYVSDPVGDVLLLRCLTTHGDNTAGCWNGISNVVRWKSSYWVMDLRNNEFTQMESRNRTSCRHSVVTSHLIAALHDLSHVG